MTTLHFSNTSETDFYGWCRCNIDWEPPFQRGKVSDEVTYQVGKRTGVDTRHIDVYVAIGHGQTKSLDLAESLPSDYEPLAGYDANALQHFGGVPVTIAGRPLEHISTKANGAALDGHWRGRIGGLVVNLWIWWYPDQPWCEGRIAIVASSPGTAAVRAEIPVGFGLRFGDAVVMVPGLPDYEPLMEFGDWLADGQPRSLPLVLAFPGAGFALCRAVADQKVTMRGLKNLHQDGNPYLPPAFDAKQWAKDMLPLVTMRQHDWFTSPLDPNANSRDPGAQGSQALVGAPAIRHSAAVGVFTIAGLDVSWPMIHLEPDGSPLDWKNHPGLRMVYGRVNRRDGISTDDLGKPFDPTSADCHGYAGPDTEDHWFDWTLFAGARLNGDPCSQWILHAHACLFLFRFVTVPPANWLTTSRGIAWALGIAVECYRNLEDRELANAIKQRVHDLWPMIEAKCSNGGYWDWTDDPRIGASPGHRRSVPWQPSVLALMLDWAAFCFGIGDMWALAATISDDILTRAWVKTPDGRWHCRDVIAEDGSDIELKPDGTPHWDDYLWFGMPFGVATMLRHNEQDWRAVEIWAQYMADQPGYQQGAWLAPISKPTVGP